MTWILTHSGKKLDFDNIEAHEFDINDIAHRALRNLPRIRKDISLLKSK